MFIGDLIPKINAKNFQYIVYIFLIFNLFTVKNTRLSNLFFQDFHFLSFNLLHDNADDIYFQLRSKFPFLC